MDNEAKQELMKFINQNRLPKSNQGLTEHGKGYREGITTILKLLELAFLR